MQIIGLRGLVVSVGCVFLAACAVYYENSYVPLNNSGHSSLQSVNGGPSYQEVNDMDVAAEEMNGRGYVLLGYSQFVSPQLPVIAKTNAVLWGKEIGASTVIQRTPIGRGHNNFGYLSTYWGKRKPSKSGLGIVIQDLPPEILETMGKENNVVMVRQVIEGSPAHTAGLRVGDALLAMNGERVLDMRSVVDRVQRAGNQELTLFVVRNSEEKEFRLTPNSANAAAAIEMADREFAFHDRPWLKTRPTDWSDLGRLIEQNAELARQRAAEQQRRDRARAEAQYQQYLANFSTVQAGRRGSYSGGSGKGRRRYAGDPLPGSAVPTARPGIALESKQNFQSTMDLWRQSFNKKQAAQRNQALNIWWQNAPAIYRSFNSSTMFQRPRPF